MSPTSAAKLSSFYLSLVSTTAFGYDPNGNRTLMTDARGNSTYYEYDALNRLTVIQDALGERELYDYDANGNLTIEDFANGSAVYFAYDALDRMLTKGWQTSAGGRYAHYFEYDGNGNLTEAAYQGGVGATFAGLYFSYDGANRQTAEVLRHSGGESPLDHTVLYSYDKASRRTILSVQAGIGGSTGDGWGAEEWGDGEYGPTSGSSGWGHDAWGDSAWGGEAGSAAVPMVDYYAYDPASRLTALHATGEGTNASAYYEYDDNSNCKQKIVANGLITTYYGYDPANRISSIVHRKNDNSLLASLKYDYDPAGRIVRIDREAGLSLYYSYDDANRLTGEHWVDSMNATTYAFEWDYDPAGNRTRQLANVGMPNGSATYYDYNAANELTHLHVVGGSFGGIEPGHSYFQYDATGNLTQQQEPDGTTYYSYTPFNLVESIHHKDDSWTRCWYDGNLRRYALEDPTNGLRYFTWDQNGLNLLAEQSPTGTVTRRYTHGYSPISGIGSITRAECPSTGDYSNLYMDHRGTVLGAVDDTGSVTDYEYNAFGLV